MIPASRVVPKAVSFHAIEKQYATNSIDKAFKAGTINARDIALMREFVVEKQSCNNITLGRANKIIYTLVGWRKILGPFESNTIADIYAAKTELETSKNRFGNGYKQNTIHDWVRILKQFYMWMIENKYTTVPEHTLRKMQTPPKDTTTKVASDLLTPDEIIAMVKACKQNVDRALIMMLYEGGFRIGEIGKMKWGDVNFDKNGATVNVNFKTGRPRYIRLIMAVEYLASWRAEYPFNAEGDSLVFVNTKGEPFIHATISKRLARVAEKAGIKKHITPHVFRHSRITHLIKEKVSESVIKLMMWGNITTEMFQTYAHLTGQDIDAEMLRVYGLESKDTTQKERRLEPRQCKQCAVINPPVSKHCSNCGMRLTDDVIASDTMMQESVFNNPDTLHAYIDAVVDKKLEERKNA